MNNGLLYALSVLIWGTSWFAIEFQLGDVSPVVSICYRYLLAAAVLFAWCAFRRLPLRFDRAAHLRFAMLGVFIFGLNYICAYYAQVYISSALNAIVFSSMLWINIFYSRLFFGVRVTGSVYAGAALGMLGLIILFWPQIARTGFGSGPAIGVAISFAGAMLASLGNMVSQASQGRGLPVMQSNAFGMLYGAALMAVIALVTGEAFSFDTGLPYVTSLLYLAIVASVISFSAYLTLLGRIGAHRAGYVAVAIPVVALLVSRLFEGLTLDANVLAGVALTLAGNVLVLRRRRSPAPA